MPAEAAAAPAAPAAQAAPPPAAPPSAGATLASVPAGDAFFASFKNEEVKNYVSQKGFKTTEDLATSFFNLEKMKGVPEERLLRLPEKMDGPEARAVWEKLGAPKDAKGYEMPKDNVDPKFTEWAETTFFKNNLTKTQAQGLTQALNDYATSAKAAHQQARVQAITAGEEKLKTEWGANYDKNLNLAKQGAKILGLDPKTLDMIEAFQGRDVLFKNLQKIGVGVGESNFVDGGTGQGAALTPEQAKGEMDKLMKDQKFQKKWNRGDAESIERWNTLNKAAFPGEKPIG